MSGEIEGGDTRDFTVDPRRYIRINFGIIGGLFMALLSLGGFVAVKVLTHLDSELNEHESKAEQQFESVEKRIDARFRELDSQHGIRFQVIENAVAGKADRRETADRWTSTHQQIYSGGIESRLSRVERQHDQNCEVFQ